jgi:hypothetical protein
MMFLILLFLWVVAFYSLLPLLESMEPVIQGLSWGIILGALIVIFVWIGIKLSRATIPKDFSATARPLDTSRVTRVVRERTGDELVEHIVYGTPETTFREACEDNWLFKTVDRDDQWVIQDSSSNDMTDRPLIECNGIATIMIYGDVPAYSEDADHLPEWWDTKD